MVSYAKQVAGILQIEDSEDLLKHLEAKYPQGSPWYLSLATIADLVTTPSLNRGISDLMPTPYGVAIQRPENLAVMKVTS